MIKLFSFVTAVFLSGVIAHPALAQPAGQPIRFIIGSTPGGPIDAYARTIADPMSRALNRTIVIETKSGANGNISAQYMLTTPPDGTTVWVGTAGMTEINPVVYPNLAWSIDDFIPVIKGVEATIVLSVNPSVPAKTLAELVEWVKANPGKLSYASWSPGTPSSFLGFQLNQRFNLDLTHVPYKGSSQQISDLIGGQVPLGFTQVQQTIPAVQAGQLRAIATTGKSAPRFSQIRRPLRN